MQLREKDDSRRILIISRAFDQIQVFDQMLGGYFGQKKKFDYGKIEMARAYDQTQAFVHSLGGYSHRERRSCTREI
jgi:hypothetical protein